MCRPNVLPSCAGRLPIWGFLSYYACFLPSYLPASAAKNVPPFLALFRDLCTLLYLLLLTHLLTFPPDCNILFSSHPRVSQTLVPDSLTSMFDSAHLNPTLSGLSNDIKLHQSSLPPKHSDVLPDLLTLHLCEIHLPYFKIMTYRI